VIRSLYRRPLLNSDDIRNIRKSGMLAPLDISKLRLVNSLPPSLSLESPTLAFLIRYTLLVILELAIN